MTRTLPAVWQPPDKEKRPSRPDDWREHKALSYGFVVAACRWARWVQQKTGCMPYLVGSALDKQCPRDVDIALIWHDAMFEREFGPLPRDQEEYAAMWGETRYRWATHAFLVSAWEGIGYCPYVDIHLAPRSWWPERPKLYLGGWPDDPLPRVPHIDDGYILRETVNTDGKTLFSWTGGGQ